jgi:hypothetical protein
MGFEYRPVGKASVSLLTSGLVVQPRYFWRTNASLAIEVA